MHFEIIHNNFSLPIFPKVVKMIQGMKALDASNRRWDNFWSRNACFCS
jgi:hypothetical protein